MILQLPSSTLFPYTTLFRSFLEGRPEFRGRLICVALCQGAGDRSEEHTSELQSHLNLVCRLLLVKKNTTEKIVTGGNWRTTGSRFSIIVLPRTVPAETRPTP